MNTLIAELEAATEGSRELDGRIHEAIGWVRLDTYDECSQFTPGARWVGGAEYYESMIRYYFPPDLRQQWEEMYRDETGEDPPKWNEEKAKDWWMSDPHDEQYPSDYTNSLDAALTLMPDTAINFHLFSFIGHGVAEFGKTAWGFGFADTAQLMGARAAKEDIERMKHAVGWGEFVGPPVIKMEKAIAGHFIEFNCQCAATPALALCIAALRACRQAMEKVT
jgi:hypothetical protein